MPSRIVNVGREWTEVSNGTYSATYECIGGAGVLFCLPEMPNEEQEQGHIMVSSKSFRTDEKTFCRASASTGVLVLCITDIIPPVTP